MALNAYAVLKILAIQIKEPHPGGIAAVEVRLVDRGVLQVFQNRTK